MKTRQQIIRQGEAQWGSLVEKMRRATPEELALHIEARKVSVAKAERAVEDARHYRPSYAPAGKPTQTELLAGTRLADERELLALAEAVAGERGIETRSPLASAPRTPTAQPEVDATPIVRTCRHGVPFSRDCAECGE